MLLSTIRECEGTGCLVLHHMNLSCPDPGTRSPGLLADRLGYFQLITYMLLYMSAPSAIYSITGTPLG